MQEEKDFSFIQENVKPKKNRKGKKFLASLATTIVLAAVFGVTACASFYIAKPYLKETLDPQPEETRKPVSLTAEPTAAPTTEPSPTPAVQQTQKPAAETEKEEGSGKKLTIKDYTRMNLAISNYAQQIEKSVVTVTKIQEEEDIFENTEITADSFYGLILAENGKELLLLTAWRKLEDYSRLEVRFADQTVCEAEVTAFDRDLGIAVLAVSLEQLSEETLQNLEMAKLGDSYYLSVGTPLLALGSPNGYVFSRELGVIMNAAYDTYIPDAALSLFNTDMKRYENGEGFVVNFNGEVVGLLTKQFDNELNDGMFVFLGISKLKPTIEKMLNQEERVSFGVVAKDMTAESLAAVDAESGIYVSEVIPDSAAYQAGLVNGDVIISVNQKSINTVTAFSQLLGECQVKEQVRVKVIRTAKTGNPKLTLNVTLGKKQ